MKRRVPLKRKSDFGSAPVKDRIQALLRLHVIKSDHGCVLRHFADEMPERFKTCGPLKKDGTPVLQAEHLVTRANSVSYADLRNIVCLCKTHHFYFKKQHGRLYWELIRRYIGEERWNWIKRVEAEYNAHKTCRFYESDWLKAEAELLSTLRPVQTFKEE